MITQPMLAKKIEKVKNVEYPLLGTPKLDGIRALTINGVLVSRTFKPIKNEYIRNLCLELPDNLDGELIAGDTFSETSSAIMSEDGYPEFKYWVFDYVGQGLSKPYRGRMEDLESLKLPDYCIKVLPVWIDNDRQREEWFLKYMSEGYEGLMVRPPNSPYDCKRSSNLLKIKRFHDSEAEVIGFEEKMHNENVAEKDVFGKTKRSHKKAGQVPANTLGSLVVRDIYSGVEFKIGTGFDEEQRQDIWTNKADALTFNVIKYKYQKEGGKDKPRFPVFLGFRDKEDM